jgi:hypothetical protein
LILPQEILWNFKKGNNPREKNTFQNPPAFFLDSRCHQLKDCGRRWSTGELVSPLITDLFGLKSHATLYSFAVFTSAIGSAAGPVIVGILFDLTGKYSMAFILCLIVSLIAFGGVWFLRPICQDEK